ncbi:MAG: GGDEF domain-containing protein [Leptolyngbyaceae cyanobacterium MO_188.B28]|nr:GGDEF domain-containing protein [Leptolyngbyaceae cyanobacterium MO_188.B28]
MKRKIIEFLEHWPKWTLLGLSIGMGLLIGAIDFLVRLDIAFSIFYLAPVAIAAWFIGGRMGMMMSLFCTWAWLQADIAAKDYVAPLLPYWNAIVRLIFFAIVTYLLTALREAYQREQQLARLDSLTGISNRRFFLELLQVELDRARRYQYPLTLAYLDLDDFKAVNDQLGHNAGDRLLQSVAQILTLSVRSHDVAARLGGDEFAILLPQTNDNQARKALTRTYHQLQTLNQSDPYPVGFSIGAITFTTLPTSTDELIAQADQLMYAIKRSGKNRLVCEQSIKYVEKRKVQCQQSMT